MIKPKSEYERLKRQVLRRCREIVSDGAEVRYPGRLCHRLAAETEKARLPTVVRMAHNLWSEIQAARNGSSADGLLFYP